MEKKLVLKNDLEQLLLLAEFIEKLGEAENWEEEFLMNLSLVLEEAVTNVILYAFGQEIGCQFELLFTKENEEICFVLTDSGIPFDPTQRESPNLALPPEQRPIGGLGIVLMYKILDKVEYRRENECNILVMRKKLSS